MKFVDEYRDPARAKALAEAVRRITTRPHTLMEICGGQTHSIVRFGIDQLLPPEITLVHGPGCPVCVTPAATIDKAVAIAGHENVILCSFGDMLRVPGSASSLFSAKANGADVRIVYSPLDAVRLAAAHPEKQVVFLAVGFETTAPANALAVLQADKEGIRNFSLLSAHVLVPPAIAAILSSEECRVQGFLAAGHVCTVMGYAGYESLAARFRVPIVVTGFEPVDILNGIYRCVVQLERGSWQVENAYARSVRREGNARARELLELVFRVTSCEWRGLGILPESGLTLKPPYDRFDAERRFEFGAMAPSESGLCISGRILQGLQRPSECPAFGHACRPESPLGAPMVSSEGACAAYYRYRRDLDSPTVAGASHG